MFDHVSLPKGGHDMGIVGAFYGRWSRASLAYLVTVKLAMDGT